MSLVQRALRLIGLRQDRERVVILGSGWAGYTVALVTSLRIGAATYGIDASLSATGYNWLGILGGVVVTTMQVQDLKDQAGDRARGRKTWPLVVGDSVSRRWLRVAFPASFLIG